MRILGEVNIPLIAISSSEPTVCEIGDKYFNSSTKLIYRAVILIYEVLMEINQF